MIETLTVFDDVFVPWERVFFHRRPDFAGGAALRFVEYHRFTAVATSFVAGHVCRRCDSNCQSKRYWKAGHVKDKLTWLAGYAETVRGLTELAALRCQTEEGMAYPHVFTTNMAKWTFARDFHKAVEIVQDLAGGILVTGPWARIGNPPKFVPYSRNIRAGLGPRAAAGNAEPNWRSDFGPLRGL